MSDKDLIVPSGIPQFTGDLETLDTESKSLATNAKLFRDSGAAVHTQFQGLSACYKAPEADKLFATTQPVATKSDGFADDLEKVSSALNAYAGEVRPLKDKLKSLKDDAFAFVESIEGDDDWREDQKKVDRNNNLWHSVNATVAAFHAAERACHDKIVALVKGTPLIADDGSHQPNMYGYKASDLDHAEETPWGKMAEREYTGIEWLGHQIKSFVWDGFIVDGVWGTIKGLGTLVGTDGWDAAGQAWTGLAKLATGLAITATPLGAAYWMAPEDKLPSWLRDSRTAVKETGKALIAYDQWGKNPARAAGGVTFNVLTTVFTGGAGGVAKGGAAAKAISVAGKVSRVVDPITYIGKAGKFTFVKVGDLMAGLKSLNPGASLRIAGETFKLADEAAAAKLPERPAGLPDDAAPFVDNKGRPVYLDPKTGKLFDEHGKVKQAAEDVPKEPSAAERAAEAERARTPEPEKVLVGAGARAGSEVTASVGRTGDNAAGGAARDVPGGGTGNRAPGGSAHDLGQGPSASHGTPGASGGGAGGGHATPHTGGGGGHDVPGSGTGGHGSGGHGSDGPGSGGHGSGGHGSGGHGDTPPRDGDHGNGGGHDTPSGNPHEADGAHGSKPEGTDNSGPGGAHGADGGTPPHTPAPARRPVGDFVPGSGKDLTPEQLQEGLQQALDGDYAGLRIKVDGVFPMDNQLGWSAQIVDQAGNPVGRMDRDFIRKEDGTLAVKHNIMKIDDPAYRGKGVGSAISRDLENWYRKSGVSEIQLTAAKENGAYTWARRDYDWVQEKSAKKIFNRINVKMKDPEWDLSPEELAAAQDIVNRARNNPFGSPDYPTPREIANIGRGSGRENPFGKRVLVGQRWEGRKLL
ncbi:hypothetical protein [Streptomyces syringium]|uniref:hypothetical protein n=1 Tax=Streptomyces syringium TaxID=76729 RepID=UPI0033B1C9B9